MAHAGNGYLVEKTKVTITSQGLSFSVDGSEGPYQLGPGSIMLPKGEKVVLSTVHCKNCVNGYYMIDESIQRVGYFEFKGSVVSFSSLITFCPCPANSAAKYNFFTAFKGKQIHKIGINYYGDVLVDTILEPYDLTINAYKMSVTNLVNNIEYNAYVSQFKLSPNGVSKIYGREIRSKREFEFKLRKYLRPS